MVVLRIKEYDNGEVCLEYRSTRRARSIEISSGKVDMVSYYYFKLGTFIKGSGIIVGSTNPIDIDIDIDPSYDLIKALSEVGENSISDFTIEIAVVHDEYLEETQIENIIKLFRLDPKNVLLVMPNS